METWLWRFRFARIFDKCFIKAIRLLSRVEIDSSKHLESWENSRKLCKPPTASQVCITVSKPLKPPRVYKRPCKQRKVLSCLNLKAYQKVTRVCCNVTISSMSSKTQHARSAKTRWITSWERHDQPECHLLDSTVVKGNEKFIARAQDKLFVFQ